MLIVAALATGLLAVGLEGCGSSARVGQAVTTAVAAVTQDQGLQGMILWPTRPAPKLALHNYTGQPVSLATMRGTPVLVTFVYTHCPDVCPLIVATLAAAERQLRSQHTPVRIVAVTVDPKRDTPTAIRKFLAARGALGRMDYLLGTRPQLLHTWQAWDVGVTIDRKQVTVGHSSVVYGVTAGGRLAVVYPSNLTPGEIVHDVPQLARM
jgi:protein SCO1/2